MNVNKVFLGGRLTRDPEIKRLGDDSVVCNFSVAVNRRKKDDSVDFFNCEAWGSTAQAIVEYLKKGSSVFIEGRMKLEKWETPSKEKRSAIKVVVISAEFLNGTKQEN